MEFTETGLRELFLFVLEPEPEEICQEKQRKFFPQIPVEQCLMTPKKKCSNFAQLKPIFETEIECSIQGSEFCNKKNFEPFSITHSKPMKICKQFKQDFDEKTDIRLNFEATNLKNQEEDGNFLEYEEPLLIDIDYYNFQN